MIIKNEGIHGNKNIKVRKSLITIRAQSCAGSI